MFDEVGFCFMTELVGFCFMELFAFCIMVPLDSMTGYVAQFEKVRGFMIEEIADFVFHENVGFLFDCRVGLVLFGCFYVAGGFL